jgi:molecular chaperone GrpE
MTEKKLEHEHINVNFQETHSEEDIPEDESLAEALSAFGSGERTSESAPVAQVQELQTQIEQLQVRNEQLMRVAADFENYQRRTAREREDLIKFAGQQIVTNLLDVLDNMERALQNDAKPEDLPHFVEGVRMIHKQFLDVLQRSGVSVIESVGQPFNPSYHEAIMSEASSDYPDETVIAEFQKGYQMNGKVLRPSMVKVSKEA